MGDFVVDVFEVTGYVWTESGVARGGRAVERACELAFEVPDELRKKPSSSSSKSGNYV